MSLEKSLNWEEKYDDMSGAILVAPQTSWLKTLRVLWLKKEDWIYKEFKWKNITDIGSGIWWFIFEIENSCNHISAVDPLYSSKNIGDLLSRDKNRICSQIKTQEWVLAQKQSTMLDISNTLEADEKLIKIIKKNLSNKKEVLDDIQKWENRWFESSEKIEIIWKEGENTWIDSNTQDYVFLKHVINKESVDTEKIIKEAIRITKVGGEVIIIDDTLDKENLQNILSWIQYIQDTKEHLQIIRIKK